MSSLTDASLSRQIIFFSTGSVAGVCSASADYAFDRVSSVVRGSKPRAFSALIQSMVPHIIRPGIRFWGFDLAKTFIVPDQLPVSLKGGLAGAAGGFMEMSLTNAHSAMTSSKGPSMRLATRTTLLHSAKLCLCFGTYTYLANTYSDKLPPRPFPYCLILGALAGALGTTLISPLEMYSASPYQLSSRQVFKTAMSRAPRGAVGVGTVIAVQVTSSAWLLRQL